jgi:hypothetical protein
MMRRVGRWNSKEEEGSFSATIVLYQECFKKVLSERHVMAAHKEGTLLNSFYLLSLKARLISTEMSTTALGEK